MDIYFPYHPYADMMPFGKNKSQNLIDSAFYLNLKQNLGWDLPKNTHNHSPRQRVEGEFYFSLTLKRLWHSISLEKKHHQKT
ncbi:MAG: hypothetical protein HQL77_17235 [Magnetococcales bacterium]|nr:hypothetical protein [Magnetococcales bacterium]